MGWVQTWLSHAPSLGKQPWGSLAAPLPQHPTAPVLFLLCWHLSGGCLLRRLNTVPCACWFGLRRVCFACPLLSDGNHLPSPGRGGSSQPCRGRQDPPGLFFNVLTLLFGVRPCLVPTVFQPLSQRTPNKLISHLLSWSAELCRAGLCLCFCPPCPGAA